MSLSERLSGLVVTFLAALLFPQAAHAILVPPFSEGMLTPETISQIPVGFGSHAGDYLIPDIARGSTDPNLHTVWMVPQNGGPPAVFSSGNSDMLIGGLFLPSSWGANAGKYLTVGRDLFTGPGQNGTVYTYAPDGSRELFGNYVNMPFSTPRIAPDGFGAFGGKMFVAEVDNFGRVDVISPDSSFIEGFADASLRDLVTQAFGLAFAPTGFGSVGGKLLVSDPFTGKIAAVDADGSAAPFASIPLLQGQTGLRQMEFAPTDFLINLGIPGDLLMVSVSGSLFGGGSLGDVVALNGAGDVVASLRVIGALDKFDPRGMLFTPEGELLISDASDPVQSATADDFRLGRFANAVPEPSILLLLGIGLAGVSIARGRGRRSTKVCS